MDFGHNPYDGHNPRRSPYESMYSCADCGKLYMHKRTLKRHELVHSATACFTCMVCGKQYSQQYDLERHSRSHRGEKPFKCYVCGRPFAMSHHLNNHMVTHTGIRAYSCLVCSKRFAQTFSLKRHMRMHLRAADSVAADTSTGAANSSADNGRSLSVSGMALLQSLSCNVCGKIFSQQQTLKRHRCQLGNENAAAAATHTRRSVPTAGVEYTSRPSQHKCHECGIQFSTAHQLNDHVSDEHPDRPSKKPYACGDCSKSFAHPYSLKRHRVEHGGDAHVCPTCGKRFAQLYELSRHLRSHNVDRSLDTDGYPDQPVSLAFSPTGDERERLDADSALPPNESPGSFSAQIAKYMALQDAQAGLAGHLMFRDGPLPKPPDVGLLAFAHSLVVSSAAATHASPYPLTAASTDTD